MANPVSSGPRQALRWLVLLVPVAQLAVILWVIWTRSADVPVNDEWAMTRIVRAVADGELGPGDFWAFHNEHRIVVPRLTTLALIEATGWHRQVLMSFNVLVAVASAWFLLLAARTTFRSSTLTAAFVVPLSLLILSLARYHNWLKPFTDKIWTGFGAALCAYALIARPVTNRRFALAVGAALVASLSSLGGLVAWVAFLPAVWIAGRRFAAIWLACAAATIVPYAVGFPGDASSSLVLAEVPGTVVAYLGAPLFPDDLVLAQVAGSLGVTLGFGALLAARFLWRPERGDVQCLVGWVGLALFAGGCALLTALGSREGPLSSRYQALSVLWWGALVAVVATVATRLWLARRLDPDRSGTRLTAATAGTAAVAVAVIVVGLVRANVSSLDAAANWQTAERQNQGCVEHYRLASDDCLLLYSPSANSVRRNAAFLEAHQMAVFRDPPAPDLGGLAPAAVVEGTIDRVGAERVKPSQSAPISLPTEEDPLVVAGSVGLPVGQIGGVVVAVDDRRLVALHGEVAVRGDRFARPAAVAGVPFRATIPAEALPVGLHTLTLEVVSADRGHYYSAGESVTLEILGQRPGSNAASPTAKAPAAAPDRPRVAATPRAGGDAARDEEGLRAATPRVGRARPAAEDRDAPQREGRRTPRSRDRTTADPVQTPAGDRPTG